MSARGAFLTVLASALFACALPSAAQDENPTTPGAIPNAGSYQGSIALQQQQQQQEQAQQQQNLQMQQRLDQTYRAYAPRGGGGGEATRSGPPPVNWWAKPPLPASRNPLLGHWKQVPSEGYSASQIAGGNADLPLPGMAQAAAGILSAGTAAACKSIFGTGVVAFEPDSLQWVAPDGHEEILNHVAYRASGGEVVMLSRDPGAIEHLIFGFPNHDHAVVAFFQCSMRRLGADLQNGGTPGPAAAQNETGQRLLPLQAAPAPSGAANSVLKFMILEAGPGYSSPLAGAQFWLLAEDPAQVLAKPGGVAPPAQRITTDCQQAVTCKRDFQVLTAKAVATITTDATGKAQAGPLPAGRYYAVGLATYQGRRVFWLRGINLVAGVNGLTLDQTDGGALP